MVVARRAGTQLAKRATAKRNAGTLAKVSGSRGDTSMSSSPSPRDAPSATAIPSAMPASAGAIPWRITIRSTSVGSAPSARRMPISCVRCATEYAMTP